MKKRLTFGKTTAILESISVAFAACLIFLAPTLVRAQFDIDFSSLTPGTQITTQYASRGITFSTLDADDNIGAPAIGRAPYLGGLSNSPTGSYPTTEFLNFNFTHPAYVTSFTFSNYGDNIDPGSSYTAYNSDGVVVGTGALNLVNGGITITVDTPDVSLLQFTNGKSIEPSGPSPEDDNNWEIIVGSITYNEDIALSTAGLTPNQQAVLGPLNQAATAGNSNPKFYALFGGLFNTNSLGAALDSYSPQKLQVFSDIAFDNFGFNATQLDNHTASLRYGQGGFDASGLQVLNSSSPAMLSEIEGRLLAFNASPTSNGAISDVGNSALSGVKMSDPKDMKELTAPVTDQNRWSAFISGNVILADIGSNADVANTHYTTGGVTAGADYRLDDNWAVGLLFGYGHSSIDLDNNGSTGRVDSYSPGLYATYADRGWYANGLFAYDYNSYGESRVIPVLGSTANGSTTGNQYGANLDGGYEFKSGDWTFGPTAALQYVHLDIDSLAESGLGALDINDQNADSLRSRLGGEMRYSWSWYGGKVTATPHVSASWQHEYLDDSRGITSQFEGAGLGSFTVTTTSPERDSALIDAGLDTQWNSALNLFVDYQVQAGQSNFFGESIEGGAKVSF